MSRSILSLRALLLLSSVLLLAAPASAQSIDGRLRLHLETGAFGVTRATRTYSDGRDASSSTLLAVGPSNTNLGLGAGFGVSDSVVLGTNLTLSVLTSLDEGESDALTRLSLAPYVEAWLGDGAVRPFLGAQAALGYASLGDSDVTTFGVLAMLGAHFFLTESSTFDLSVRPFVERASDDSNALTSYGVLAMVGVSAWGGGG